MTRRSHHGLGIAAVALALGLGGACGNTVSYTYVDVDVEVDTASLDATHLFLVTRCEFTVSGADETSSGVGLPCRENNVRPRVGTFQWSSEATSGSLQFTVNLFDANRVVLGSGTSDPVAVSPGKHLTTSVLVLGVAQPDAGTADTGGSADAGGAPDAAATDSEPTPGADAGVD